MRLETLMEAKKWILFLCCFWQTISLSVFRPSPVSEQFLLNVVTYLWIHRHTVRVKLCCSARVGGAAEWVLQWRQSKSLSFRVATIVPPDAVCFVWLRASLLIVLSLSPPQLLLQASAEEWVHREPAGWSQTKPTMIQESSDDPDDCSFRKWANKSLESVDSSVRRYIVIESSDPQCPA